jgi:hypothetical protein
LPSFYFARQPEQEFTLGEQIMTTKLFNRLVDHSAIRVNQSFIIGLLILAFVLSSPLIVAFVAGVMLIGTAWPTLALFQVIYRSILKQANLVRPHTIVDNPEPHRFAQGLGGIAVTLRLIALLAGQNIVGWALVWMVVALAALNLFVGFCAGCFVYYQLNRLGVPGFRYSPIRQG